MTKTEQRRFHRVYEMTRHLWLRAAFTFLALSGKLSRVDVDRAGFCRIDFSRYGLRVRADQRDAAWALSGTTVCVDAWDAGNRE